MNFESWELSIKVRDKQIHKFITNLLENSANNKSAYADIFDKCSKEFNNFYTGDYLQFILSKLVDSNMLFEANKNYELNKSLNAWNA